MKNAVEKEIDAIYKSMVYHSDSRKIVERHAKATDKLQEIAQSFTKEQWAAVKNYQLAFMELHNEMMRRALKKRK